MICVMVRRTPWTMSWQNLFQTEAVPMCIGSTTPDIPRVHIDIVQDGIVIGRSTCPSGSEHTRESGHIHSTGRSIQIERCLGAGNDTKGRQRSVGWEKIFNPCSVVQTFLQDPISTLGCILVKINPQSTFFVPMFDNQGGCFEKG